MAKNKMSRGGGPAKASRKGLSGLYEMNSGLLHTSDSNAGAERGTFVDFYGAPGAPDEKNSITSDANSLPGRQPKLGRKWMRDGNGSTGKGKR